MIVVTGAAGFIGSCVVAKLNELGREDLILVDQMNGDSLPGNGCNDLKKVNLENKKYVFYFEKDDFLEMVENNKVDEAVDCVIHMGACSSTTLQDEGFFKKNNFEYTQKLAQWALDHNVRFIYASSAATYGDGSNGYKDDESAVVNCHPLNLYGLSKQNFDLWALENNLLDKIVGLKFFNVFGPNEYHKLDMRSVVAKAYQKVVDEGKISLFKSYNDDYGDGEQKRDFIYVKDAVNVIMYFVNHRDINGLFNVGTGQARTWNDLANALFAAVNGGKKANIEYIEMPETLRDKYQYFTQADMTKLRDSGYKEEFTSLEDAVKDYTGFLKDNKIW